MKSGRVTPGHTVKGDNMRKQVYIPENDYGIREGYYDHRGIVTLLRTWRDSELVVQFIAGMME